MPQFLVTVAPREPSSGGESVHALYLLAGPTLTPDAVAQLAADLLHDPVVQSAAWRPLSREALAAEPAPMAASIVEVAYRPGVTDNEGESVLEGARRLGVPGLAQARALRRHLLPPDVSPTTRGAELAIDLVQTTFAYAPGQAPDERLAFYANLIAAPAEISPQVARVPLRIADDEELLRISRDGVLALDLAELRAVRDYFAAIGRDPSDGELETIAQTWSEHCSHKTFKAKVRYRAADQGPETRDAGRDKRLYPMLALLERGEVEIDSLIKTFLMVATEKVLAARDDEWVLSAFIDNAGIIAFGEGHEVSFKVETHNHPSALEPFGGANTGVGGVIRDVLGVSAEPIANTDVLCFGMPDTPPEQLPPGVLHPRRVATGVVAGVRDYGNKLGIPTVNGAVLFDPGYAANPLVYAGTVGIAPRGMHPRSVQPGDAAVVLGGRTGRDGIHGATFSSIELTHETATTVGSAVQIGDPITEKKLLDVLLQARDQRLYSAITDCGAGGLSSAVGEMGAECGVSVELERVPRKYAGLQPWEVWLSEAQERMVLAVPPASLTAFLALCAAEDVEATVIGAFADDGHLRVTHAGQTVVDIDMAFLHDGRPQRVLEAVWEAPPAQTPARGETDLAQALMGLLAHPNIASKERIVRTYDHEVRGATVVKPLVGAQMDGPGDAAVLRPLPQSLEGIAIGNGVNPRYGRIDPYWMALAAVDEALRNVVAVGGDPGRTAILDNFCWGDPRQPDRMAGLVRAAAGCYDAAVAFGTPFISGKDSLNNEYRDATGARVAIPPTLLISAISHVPDVRRCVTMDLKEAGDALYVVGATRDELGGSHLAAVAGREPAASVEVPKVDLAAARAAFAALHGA
ncbi:MAG: phosphoribosylformylglycinamidine synthase subunit PurL, partial [Chloroflexales bacterium]|nr:phosphoribosylformylglycinamidine synthase subunit PurL [Chloroflexales bacterium]